MREREGCLFCRLGRPPGGEARPFLVLTGEQVVAFPALHPVDAGHLVVIPVEHYEEPGELPAETSAALLARGAELGEALKEELGCSGYSLVLHAGHPGQPLPHVHLHVLPRREGDPLDTPRPPEADREQLLDLAERLRSRMG